MGSKVDYSQEKGLCRHAAELQQLVQIILQQITYNLFTCTVEDRNMPLQTNGEITQSLFNLLCEGLLSWKMDGYTILSVNVYVQLLLIQPNPLLSSLLLYLCGQKHLHMYQDAVVF